MKKSFLGLLFFSVHLLAFPQADSGVLKTLDELIVTATRTERKLGNVSVPVQLIAQKSIQQSGSVRLNDILAEQSGLYITGAGATSSAGGGVFGNGVQIQGLSPDYTLILLDGEPVIGRQGGVIDLSRITVNNIKKIEIVKGPSSSLYGSEAMGGVVNIITQGSATGPLHVSMRHGRFNASDAGFSSSVKNKNWGLQVFGNRNSSDGYDLNPSVNGKTVDPFRNYTGQIRFDFRVSDKTKLRFSSRYFNEIQDNYFQISEIGTGNSLAIMGDGRVRDLNLNPVLTTQISSRLKTSSRFYYSRYAYEQKLVKASDKTLHYYDFFQQNFFRAENQTDWHFAKKHFLSLGAGLVKENLNTTRYAGKRHNNIHYLFLQHEWRTNENLTLIGGLRFDDNSAYQSRLSPKISGQYKVSDKLRIKASFGGGFKAPDFRQLFLNFLNTAAGGYVIYGANEITLDELHQQKQQGILSDILPRASELALLKPEISNGFNTGFHYTVNDRWQADLNLFRNDIRNLIQVDVIAFRSNASPVYSYFNVKKAYTQGAEFNNTFRISQRVQLSAGYQFLVTADKADLARIRSGSVYTRDPQTNETFKVKRSDYAGLPNRSKHMVNIKLFYENAESGWSGSCRLIWRSRWGTFDKDGNGIINRSDEFAKSSALINVNAARQFASFRIQAGIDNLLNFKDVINQPGQPGIQPYLSVQYAFIKNTKTKKR